MSGLLSTLSNMAICHLVRHGRVENPHEVIYADLPGFGLSQLGIGEAQDASRHLSKRPVRAVYCSPLLRAVQTASIFARALGLAEKPVADLTEWGLLSLWKGRKWEEVEKTNPDQISAYFNHPWDMDFSPETLQTLGQRVSRTISRLANEYRQGEIVAVSHQDSIQAGLLCLTEQPFHRFWENKPQHAEVITLQSGTPWKVLSRYAPNL